MKSLARLSEIEIVQEKPTQSASAVVGEMKVYLPLAELLDLDVETKRQQEELANLQKYVKTLTGKLSNEEFVKNAPANIVETERKKLAEAQSRIEKISSDLKELQ